MSGASERGSIPVACKLDLETMAERRQEVQERLFAHQLSREELPEGYAFRFPGDPEIMRHLAEFVLYERQCCPFFTFEVIFEADQGPATLRLLGPEGTKEFLEGMKG
jgi:hypothetical protein